MSKWTFRLIALQQPKILTQNCQKVRKQQNRHLYSVTLSFKNANLFPSLETSSRANFGFMWLYIYLEMRRLEHQTGQAETSDLIELYKFLTGKNKDRTGGRKNSQVVNNELMKYLYISCQWHLKWWFKVARNRLWDKLKIMKNTQHTHYKTSLVRQSQKSC